METGTSRQKIDLAFINDKSPILDIICNDLIDSGFDVLFRTENIEDGLSKLSTLKAFPKACIIDLDFYDKSILKQLRKLRSEYPKVKLIAHSDIDNEKVGKALLDMCFSSFLLLGSNTIDFKKAIKKVVGS
ncbi:hypothetical protein SAMN02927916_3163 [Flavobacterium anhuiense]|uniref:Response regulatory domain-containing protein n=1 Tax=Flavobacterium anhuiense TaxID=459526 RepID=A0ABY0LWV5_9FLAO|nr:response regulator transcription factor [Flavobacterium anhuiense]SCY74759.1 hypothetical protein SAMN02927916_3163 [Flavobacterium anhuiense]